MASEFDGPSVLTTPGADLPEFASDNTLTNAVDMGPSLVQTALPIEAARDFFTQLGKALKSIALYQHIPAKFPEYVARPFGILTDILQSRSSLSVKIEAHDFLLGNEGLLPPELRENMAYRFFKDGVRRLTFRTGVTLDELVIFSTLVSKSPRAEGESENLLETLWAADLEHIEQLVVESLDLPNVSSQQMEVEVDAIVGYLAHTLQALDPKDHIAAARLRASDLALKLEELEQSRSLDVAAGLVLPALREQALRDIVEEEPLLATFVVRALLETVADGIQPTQIQDLRSFLTKMLDALLMSEDFSAIERIKDRLAALPPPFDQAIYGFFREKMGEADRIGRVAAVLRQGAVRHRREMQRYLMSLDPQTVPGLLRELETIDSPEGREIMRDALATIGRDNPEPFVARLAVANSTLAVDVLHILARQRTPGRVRYLEQALQNPNAAVRLEVVSASRALHPEAARGLLVLALRDESAKVRALAAQRLAEIGAKGCYPDLAPLLNDAQFFDRPLEERWALYLAAASSRDGQAMRLLSTRIQRPKGLFTARKHAEDRILALEALATWPSVTGCEALQDVADDKHNPSDIRAAARNAADKAQRLLEREG